MTSNGNSENEAVNGKIDLGVRKLKCSYVENATTLYAYLEAEFDYLKDYIDKMNAGYERAGKIEDKMNENEIYLVYSDKDKCAARARVEQTKAGPGGSKVRARLVDIGRGDMFDPAKFRPISDDLKKLHVHCQRYKLADLKPKGRDEGFSAMDREKGAEWLRVLLQKFGPIIKAKCHQIVNYKGGIMFEGEVGGKNINQLALMQGLAVPNPFTKQLPFVMHPPHPGFVQRPQPPPMPHHQEWDKDYLEYGGAGRMNNARSHPNAGMNPRPLRRPGQSDNQGSLPVPGGYNPYKNSGNDNRNSSNEAQKLKKTVRTLEASLAKKNKEIAELKKANNKSEENNMESLAEVVARVQALRINHNPKDDQRVRDKVSDTARLVTDVHNSLTLLGKRSSDADKAVAMLNQCQEQMLTLEDSKPLEVTLDGAKQAVVKYAGSYILEFNELRSHLDDGCEVLQQVLATDVPGPQIKLNVGQLEAQKRKEIVDVATQMAEQWSKEDKKELARDKSDESLANLINGLSETVVHLQGAAKGQGLPQRPFPNLGHLTKKALNSHNSELGLLSPPGSVAAECSGTMNYASVMATLAKAIAICLAEKSVAEDKFQKYSEVTNY